MTRSAVVVPTNRPERMQEFCTAWEEQFNSPPVRVIVVVDGPDLLSDLPPWVEQHCWGDIDVRLGEKASCIGRKSGAVRSFGYWLAAQDESVDMIVSLDDDVRPVADSFVDHRAEGIERQRGFLGWHLEVLSQKQSHRWCSTIHIRPRGLPYNLPKLPTMLNHGLWRGMPDVDAYTQLQGYPTAVDDEDPSYGRSWAIPPGQYFPLCSMNYAFRREVAPYVFLPPPPDGMRRWNDIWSGIVFKRLADLHGWAVTSGYPCVRHERASAPVANLRQEMLGYGLNERLWQVVDRVQKAATPLSTYRAITVAIRNEFPELAEMADAMWLWSTLWTDTETPAAKVVRLDGQAVGAAI